MAFQTLSLFSDSIEDEALIAQRVLDYRINTGTSEDDSTQWLLNSVLSNIDRHTETVEEILLDTDRYPNGFVFKSPILRIGQKKEFPERDLEIKELRDALNSLQYLAQAYAMPSTTSVANPYYQNLELKDIILNALERAYQLGVNEKAHVPHFFPTEEDIAFIKSRPEDESHLSAISLRLFGYYHTVLLMADDLMEAGLLDKHAKTCVRLYSQIFREIGEPIYGMNCPAPDPSLTHYVNTDELIKFEAYVFPLVAILIKNGMYSEATELLHEVNQVLDQSLMPTEAWNGGFKRSGLGFHHSNAYLPVYTGSALAMSSKMVNILHGTEYEVREEVYDNLRNAAMMARVIMNRSVAPVSITGRFGSNNVSTNTASPYLIALLYLAYLPDEEPDRELLSAYARWTDSEEDLQENILPDFLYGGRSAIASSMPYVLHDQSIEDQDLLAISPEGKPQGHWVFPETYLSIHRRDEWMASVKGRGRYVWNAEEGPGQNVYGQQVSDGALLIYSQGSPIISHVGSGYQLDSGWDWYRWPGTTTIHHPMEWASGEEVARTSERLGHNHYYNSEKQRIFSNESIAGGTSLDGQGAFAMRFVDIPLFGGYKTSNLSAYKSYFFFDNKIILLGSDIRGGNREDRVNTTLFQNYLGSDAQNTNENSGDVKVNGVSFDEMSSIGDFGQFKKRLRGPVTITDAFNNGYYIPYNERVFLKMGDQGSLLTQGQRREMSYGYYATCWIDHGIDPEEDDYEVMVLVNGANSIDDVLENPDEYYRVHQNDFRAHVVYDPVSEITGYAIFNGKLREQIADESLALKRSDRPVLAMTRITESGHLELAVTDPDMGWLEDYEVATYDLVVDGLHTRKSVPSQVTLTLNGQWNGELSYDLIAIEAERETTKVSVRCYDGQPTLIQLVEE
ncbi:polysaccharide lyase family 8 super-sandwich domain-containing protein [Rubellicoccus peritrichatus]|uniref:Polysaccharide lyase family 8 super-sandwich domain-containing protein n=1 Tax=Rubellicoccus peritrichatus TaxID=3080537 RepID=A0AAQ3L6L6_9BACT|nr:polysaccharide lyase family 8 super-sandwich domain-containing protein [Puniceicoccus sp. CR14]WOO39612.1 polysaccharide lyase family 8 super-sandwich domain-containing protein [Puniceicoccus sp. CR14]